MFGCRRHRVVASGGKFSAALGVNAASNQLGNGRPRHESFGASFVLHAAQMPGRLKLSLCELGATSNGGPFYFPGNFD